MGPPPDVVLLGRRLVRFLAFWSALAAAKRGPTYTAHPRHCRGRVKHIHLAVGPDPATQMIVSFASIPSRQHPAPIGGVLVGTSTSRMNDVHLETVGESPTYYNHTVYKSSNLYYSPYYHHITVSGLNPSTTYFYRPIVHWKNEDFSEYNIRTAEDFLNEQELLQTVEDGSMDFLEEEEDARRHRYLSGLPPYDGSMFECPSPYEARTFTTAPASPGDDETITPVSFAMIGDLGQFPHSEETISRMLQDRNDINSIILAGDIAYTQLDPLRWDTFFDFFDDYNIIDRIPMQIVAGNHDIDKQANGKEIFLAYEHRFRMPRVRAPELGLYEGPMERLDMEKPPYPLPYEWGNAYYAYTYGPARFVMINSYSSMEPNSTQHNWIVHELSSVDRTVTPWVIAVLHSPLYNTWAIHRKDTQIAAAKQHLEPLFVQYKVNLVFSGHIHAYLRTRNVIHDVVDRTGPMYITVGAGGRKCDAAFWSAEPEPWVAVRDATFFGYGMLRLMNRTHAHWEWIHSGHSDDHAMNQVYKSIQTLPPGPESDKIVLENQFFL